MNGVFFVWLKAIRAFSLTASAVPVLVGAALVLDSSIDPNQVHWGLFPIVLLSSFLFHIATNLISDYYDFQKGVDTKESYGSSGVLVSGLLPPKAIFLAGILIYALACALGFLLVFFRGPIVLYFGLIGLFGGFFYCARPIGYKYWALGDLLVFFLMGPLMVVGTYVTISGQFIDTKSVLASLPVGFLVAAILHANNLRDLQHDKRAKIQTLALFLGLRGAIIFYIFLLAAAYTSVAVAVAVGVLPWPSLVVLFTLPVALKNILLIRGAKIESPERIKDSDVRTAKFQFLFGVVMTAGLAIGYLAF